MFLWILIFIGLISGLLLCNEMMDYYDFEILGISGMILIGVTMFILIIALPVEYTTNLSNIQNFKAIRETVESQRLNELSDYERVGLTKNIIEANQWLRTKRFWNQYKLINPLIPEEVDKLEFIK